MQSAQMVIKETSSICSSGLMHHTHSILNSFYCPSNAICAWEIFDENLRSGNLLVSLPLLSSEPRESTMGLIIENCNFVLSI